MNDAFVDSEVLIRKKQKQAFRAKRLSCSARSMRWLGSL